MRTGITQKIRNRIENRGLIIFDEMPHLPPSRIDELKIFPDVLGISIAFMGNITRQPKIEKMTQIMRRAGGQL
ncbi:hypothetical protein AGMMS49545_10340 [Betaproteobacteria bacterium]|nr:hypothetical protein AGMMS49545_10340 [Betaproteobacteria bacterium]GHU44342.1 hypothetical protein AGMMS50289_12420 [Betaproteobacteria bacterium]